MKNVCILKRTENTKEENEYYIRAIEKFGGTPILIDEDNLDELKNCLGIVITGGFSKGKLDDYLIEYALTNHLSLLGICQGMQSMGLYHTNQNLEKVENHHKKEGYQHEVKLLESNLSSILEKNTVMVNTYHYEMVNSSKEFQVVGYSSDGVIEALENPNHKFQIGVQWHPERMLSYDRDSAKLFQRFIDSLNEN